MNSAFNKWFCLLILNPIVYGQTMLNMPDLIWPQKFLTQHIETSFLNNCLAVVMDFSALW